MSANEIPLVLFTICAQMAVGSFVALGAIQFVVGRAAARRTGAAALDRLADPALYAIGPVMVLGLAASLAHLGNPMRALNSLRHLGESWLSAEIAFGVAFTALGALFALTQWRKWGSTSLRQALAGITAAVGVALVYVMSRVYMLPSQPAWDSWYTPVQFYATTALLGGLAVAVAFVFAATYRTGKGATDASVAAGKGATGKSATVATGKSAAGKGATGKSATVATGKSAAGKGATGRNATGGGPSGVVEDTRLLLGTSLRWISGSAICVLGVELVALPIYLLQLMGDGVAGADLADRLLTEDLGLFVTRLVLVFLGAGLLSLFLYRAAGKGVQRTAELKALAILTTAAFVLVLAAEVIGRFLFYDLQLHGFSAAWS